MNTTENKGKKKFFNVTRGIIIPITVEKKERITTKKNDTMSIKDQIIDLRYKNKSINTLLAEVKKEQAKLQNEINTVRSELNRIEIERASRIKQALENGGKGISLIPEFADMRKLKIELVNHENELQNLEDIFNKEISTVISQKAAIRDQFEKIVSGEWYKIMQKEMPKFLESLEIIFNYYIGAVRNIFGPGAYPSIYSFFYFLQRDLIDINKIDIPTLQKKINPVFVKRYGIEPTLEDK